MPLPGINGWHPQLTIRGNDEPSGGRRFDGRTQHDGNTEGRQLSMAGGILSVPGSADAHILTYPISSSTFRDTMVGMNWRGGL